MENNTESNTVQNTPANNPQTQTLSSNEKLFGALSYFTVAVMATIATKQKSAFCMFHARQGVVLIGFDLAFMVLMVLALIISPFIGYLLFFLGILSLFGLHLTGAIKAFKGEMFQLPVVYKISKNIHVEKIFASSNNSVENNVSKTHEKIEEITPLSNNEVEVNNTQQKAQTAQTPTPNTQSNPLKKNGQDMVGKAVQEINKEQNRPQR